MINTTNNTTSTTSTTNSTINSTINMPFDTRGIKYDGFYTMCKTHIVEELLVAFSNKKEYEKLVRFLGFTSSRDFEKETNETFENLVNKWFIYVTGACYIVTIKELNELQREFEADGGEIIEEYFTEYY